MLLFPPTDSEGGRGAAPPRTLAGGCAVRVSEHAAALGRLGAGTGLAGQDPWDMADGRNAHTAGGRSWYTGHASRGTARGQRRVRRVRIGRGGRAAWRGFWRRRAVGETVRGAAEGAGREGERATRRGVFGLAAAAAAAPQHSSSGGGGGGVAQHVSWAKALQQQRVGDDDRSLPRMPSSVLAARARIGRCRRQMLCPARMPSLGDERQALALRPRP